MQTYSIINFKVNLHNKVNSSVALRQIMYHSSNLLLLQNESDASIFN